MAAVEGIQKLRDGQPQLEIQFSLAGQIPQDILQQIKNTLPKVRVESLGYLTHKEAVTLMKSADLLLNFIFKGAATQMISGKLLEYMATGVPILSLGDPYSDAGQLLAKASHAKMLHAEDSVEINNFIAEMAIQKGQLKNVFPQLRDWSREAITTDLINILEGLKAQGRF